MVGICACRRGCCLARCPVLTEEEREMLIAISRGARKSGTKKRTEGVERNKRGRIIRTCEIAGCQYKTGKPDQFRVIRLRSMGSMRSGSLAIKIIATTS